jgi:hypothetical protein
MNIKIIAALVLAALSSPSFADTYQVTFGWTAPAWLPSDTPSYGAKYRVAGGVAINLPDNATPGGSYSYTAAPGALLEMCPQNKNGSLVTPDCSQAGHWIAVGASPVPPTTPPIPGGFSATIIRTGP